jgi:hypothetical protein
MAQSPCFLLPLSDSPLLLFHFPLLTWKPSLIWYDPVHLGPRLLVNWSPHFHPLPNSKIPTPWGFPELNMRLTKTTSRIQLKRSGTVLTVSIGIYNSAADLLKKRQTKLFCFYYLQLKKLNLFFWVDYIYNGLRFNILNKKYKLYIYSWWY